MSSAIYQYKTVSDNLQQVSQGRLFNVKGTFTFAAGETTKWIMLFIPSNLVIQFIKRSFRFEDHFDNTLSVKIWEGGVGITPTTGLTIRNLNRNVVSLLPNQFDYYFGTGTLTGGILQEDWVPDKQQMFFDYASNTLRGDIARVLKIGLTYHVQITRDADTNPLTCSMYFILAQSTL